MTTRKCCWSLFALTACALAATQAAEAQPVMLSKVHTEAAPLDKLRETRDALIAVTEYGAALDPAAQAVAALERRGDADISHDLLQLALVQARLEDYDAAEISYLRAIDMREQAQGIFSAGLIPAYRALGRAYLDARRFDEALTAFEHAQSLSQRNFGLFNLEQMALIDDMTEARLEAGDVGAAHDLQVDRLERAIRHFGADAPELVPFYLHLGDFFYEQRGGSYNGLPTRFRAHDQYRKALEISSASSGDSSPASLALLRRLVAVEMLIRHRPLARDRLAATLDTATDIGARERALSLAALGDWAVVQGDRASAERYYAAAYGALEPTSERDADGLFAEPVMLDFVPPLDRVEGTSRYVAWRWGTIELAFDVSADGRASGVRTVSAPPGAGDIARDYGARIAEAHFRPRLEHGRPVAHADMRYTRRFRYYPPE